MKQKHLKFDFDGNGICKLSPSVFIFELQTSKMFGLYFLSPKRSDDYVVFYFPRLSALSYFIEYYSINHSFTFWRKLLKRYPMYEFKQCRKLVESNHIYMMWL